MTIPIPSAVLQVLTDYERRLALLEEWRNETERMERTDYQPQLDALDTRLDVLETWKTETVTPALASLAAHTHAYSDITGTHGNEDHSATFLTDIPTHDNAKHSVAYLSAIPTHGNEAHSAAYALDSDVTSLGGRMTAAENEISAHAENLADLYAWNTSLESSVNSHEGRLDTAEPVINSNSTDIITLGGYINNHATAYNGHTHTETGGTTSGPSTSM
jgi:hypothetical protein